MQKVYKTKQSIFLLTNDTGFVLYPVSSTPVSGLTMHTIIIIIIKLQHSNHY